MHDADRYDDDDLPLARKAQGGDRLAFAELARRHQDRLFRFLLRLTGSRDDALDLVQESFLRAWQALPRWRPEAKFATWLFGIARNAAVDLLRRRGVVETAASEELPGRPDTAATPLARIEATERLRLLERALAVLSPEHREILLLREVEEMAYEDIAATLSVGEGTVKSRLSRARAAVLTEFRRLARESEDE
ncbi:MAG: RNA polymerase sigma factor [Sphingomonadaceae bacterium]